MKLFYKLYFLFLFFFLFPASLTAENPVFAGVLKIVFPNGLTLITWQNPEAKLTTVSIWVKTGTINETPKNAGISHFLEHLIFKGTTEKRGLEIISFIESLGGDLNGFTATDFTTFHVTLPNAYLSQALETLLDLVSRPALEQADIDNEKKVVLEEIFRQDEEPAAYLRKIVYQSFFRTHPYGQSILGTPASINNLTRKEILDYLKNFYQPSNLVVVVSGRLNSAALLKQLKNYFAGATFSRTKQKQSLPWPLTREKLIEIEKPVSQTYLYLGFRAPSVKSQDSYGLDILVKILAGGQSSRLERELKEKKNLVFQIDADFTTRKYDGIFTISALTNPLKTKDAITAIKKEIKKLYQDPITAEELAKARDQIETEFYLNLESSFEKTFILGYFEAIDSLDYALGYLDKIKKITLEDLKRVSQKYFSGPGVIGVLGAGQNQTLPFRETALR